MTLFATRRDDNIKIHCTSGPVTFAVDEHALHVAHFWSEVGRLLAQDKVHRDAVGRAAYMRFNKDDSEGLTDWADLDELTRERWRHSALPLAPQ